MAVIVLKTSAQTPTVTAVDLNIARFGDVLKWDVWDASGMDDEVDKTKEKMCSPGAFICNLLDVSMV